MLRGLCILLALIPVTGFSTLIKADNILVVKSERKLYLRNGSKVVKSYPVSLGKNPTGHKVREGDKKTPEGTYLLDWRNPQSKFYKSIHISYPTPTEQEKAKQAGFNAGGMIMIHGEPTTLSLAKKRIDWTDGCIAVSNQHMDEIWHAIDDGISISIEP